MRLNFTAPGKISRGARKDQLYVTVLMPTVFKSQDTLEPLSADSFHVRGNLLVKSVP